MIVRLRLQDYRVYRNRAGREELVKAPRQTTGRTSPQRGSMAPGAHRQCEQKGKMPRSKGPRELRLVALLDQPLVRVTVFY